jgi:quercetin dioxygenase-like cupin family protein
MALHHAQLNEVVDLLHSPDPAHEAMSTSVLKTAHLQLIRLQLRQGQALHDHHVDDHLTLHCLSGEAEVDVQGQTHVLRPQHVIALAPHERHAVRATRDASLLLTLVKA